MIFFFTKFTISDHLTLSPTVQTAFSFNVQIVKQHIIIFYRSFVSLVNTIQPGPTTTVQIELIESLTILTDLSLSPLSAVVSLEHRRAKPRSWRPSTSAPSGTDAEDSSLACSNRTASRPHCRGAFSCACRLAQPRQGALRLRLSVVVTRHPPWSRRSVRVV